MSPSPRPPHRRSPGLAGLGVSIADFDHLLGAFETPRSKKAGNITDVCPFDGNPEADRLTYVSNSGDAIKFIETDTQDQYALAPGLTVTNGAWTGASGRVVSAFRHPSGDLLFITDGEPGELWVTPSATTATKIADTYDAPRRVRCAGNIVAVGCYGSATGLEACASWCAARRGHYERPLQPSRCTVGGHRCEGALRRARRDRSNGLPHEQPDRDHRRWLDGRDPRRPK
ncbi:MAG: hypothetical protein R3F05_13230 [Planctomycetota bacterium]